MNLSELGEALKTHSAREQFDTWLKKNEKPLSNYFYRLSGKDLDVLRFDNFYYECILTSPVYQEYQRSRTASEPFSFFLSLISVAAEKLATIGFDSVSKNLVVDLPDTPSKYRLDALNKFSLVEDSRTEYICGFPSVLELLDKSRLIYEDESIRPIVDVLAYYFKKAKAKLEEFGLVDTIDELKELYRNVDLVSQFPFLSHQILDDLLNDIDPFTLYPANVTRVRLEPSPSIKVLFRGINSSYFSHPEIDSDRDLLWGYSRRHILDEVILRGRGDFAENYGPISTADKVLLYCYFNMKKHFFTSYAVFQTVVDSLETFFTTNDYKPVFIDLGCGPMTSGLALADLIHTKTESGINISYIGVDRAPAMLSRADSFKTLNIFSPDSSFTFVANWNEISHGLLYELAGKNNPIIFNASYLFASSSVDPIDLANYVTEVSRNYTNVYFIFQNPNRTDRNVKYEDFKRQINATSLVQRNENIPYKAASQESNEDVSYEILKLN
jgi:hypothetical protein